jgi:hypothetical protein
MNLRHDIALSAAALLLPALTLLKPLPTPVGGRLPAKIFLGSGRCGVNAPVGTDALEGSCPDDLPRRQLGAVPHFDERFAAAFAAQEPAPVADEPPPPVPLPPVRPPPSPSRCPSLGRPAPITSAR